MISFEKYLIEIGYHKFCFNNKTKMYERTERDSISTMADFSYVYIYPSHLVYKELETVESSQLTYSLRKVGFIIGLSEAGKPITLISPRPSICIKRIRDNRVVYENEQYDDSINIVLSSITNEKIIEAIQRGKILRIDLTI